jgi:hypothetical protein
MTGATDFTKLVPGFDFLQNLMKGASAGLPNMGQWIAPTLNPEELDKRIGELRTVQFWLEQNARMLGATIQALEVQRMTLSTLQTMNLPLEQLRDSMTLRMPEVEAPAPAPASAPAPEPEPEPAAAAPAAPGPAIAPALGAVDPMQWWGALTKQFTELAASALKDVATVAPAPELVGSQTPAKKAARKSADKSPKTSPKTSAKASARKTTTAAGPRRRAGG